jgi:hypothetical protein
MSTPHDESYPAYCRERAAECRRRADRTVVSDLKAAFLDMEQMWLAAGKVADRSKTESPAERAARDTPPGSQPGGSPGLLVFRTAKGARSFNVQS